MDLSEEYEDYAAYREEHDKTAFRVKWPKRMYAFESREAVNIVKPRGFKDQYEDAPKFFGTPFSLVYACDPGARTYDTMDIFPPGSIESCPEGTYNMWRGYAAERLPANEGQPEEPTMFLDTVKTIFGDNSGFILDHMAWMLQFPGLRTDVVVILYGKEGCGKNAMYDRLLGRIMGRTYYAYTFNPEALTDKHSELNNGKILVVVDDFNPGKGKKVAEELKSRSTSETVAYEPKGIQSMQLSNYSNFVFMTNELNALSFKGECRRQVLVECSDELCGKTHADFWVKFEAYIRNRKNLRCIYDHLMDRDLSTVSLRYDKPLTQILADHKLAALDPVYLFLFDFMQIVFNHLRWRGTDIGVDVKPKDLNTQTFLTGTWMVENKALWDHYSDRWWTQQKFGQGKEPLTMPKFGQRLKYGVGHAGGFIPESSGSHRGGRKYTFDNKLLVPFLGLKGLTFESMYAVVAGNTIEAGRASEPAGGAAAEAVV